MSQNVCVVIVTYNRLETLKTALDHILAQTLTPAAILIVDNNSTDGTRQFLETLKDQPPMQCLCLPTNTGSAGAIAHAMKVGLTVGTYDYFWILDDDTFYEKKALRELVDHISRSSFDLLGLHGALIRFGKKHPLDPQQKLQPADYALIDGALIKTAAIQKAGVVDEKFFMMCDDHEYCMRLKNMDARSAYYKVVPITASTSAAREGLPGLPCGEGTIHPGTTCSSSNNIFPSPICWVMHGCREN
ncbi:glycosyltransferase [Paraflavitalea speifideaquila]|uniref:glycosyltransferase n=1 Tax=Paraflavitalea speifideaquila TaxID=3076558 RepID=UPI0028EBADD2|nr:glycosyltransferase [Paraflavitalea speifideiaquila]